jgi:vitamin B12 transporter
MFQGSTVMLPNPDIRVEKVWSFQAGFETAELKYVWLKAGVFRHDISDFIDSSGALSVNTGKQQRQGFEAEMKTMTLYNIFLSGGTTFIFAKDRSTGETMLGVPKYTYDAAITYDDKRSFKAVLKGRYIWWNMDVANSAKYSSFIVDLTLTKTLFKIDSHTLEAFTSAHNLFNGRQDTGYWYKTPKKWAEIGLRYKF